MTYSTSVGDLSANFNCEKLKYTPISFEEGGLGAKQRVAAAQEAADREDQGK
jgi:hypothetical protein